MQTEIWKDIKGYEGLYKVSNLGKVFSERNNLVLKDVCNGKGYRYVTISVGNERKNHYVHKLVATSFLIKGENNLEVNHKNGLKNDNRLYNLEWVTKGENMKHAASLSLMQKGCDKYNAIKLLEVSTGLIYMCIADAAKDKGLNYGTLKDAINKKGIYKGLKKISNG